MQIQYSNRGAHSGLTFQHLRTGFYIGEESGRLYWAHRTDTGSLRLYDLEKETECTTRGSRSGSFLRADVKVNVVGPKWPPRH